jgi:hypothetical protein
LPPASHETTMHTIQFNPLTASIRHALTENYDFSKMRSTFCLVPYLSSINSVPSAEIIRKLHAAHSNMTKLVSNEAVW